MKVLGINHIGLAASDPAKAAWFLQTVLGLQHLGDEEVASQQTLTMMFASQSQDTRAAKEPRLEILKPEPAGQGPIGSFLEKRGGGLHHLAISVADLTSAIAELEAQGVVMIDKSPRPGAHNTKIAFVHPRSTGGLLIELVQAAD